MNALSQTRQDVADTLKAQGLPAYSYLPERVSPPLVGVMAGTPFVEDGNTFTNNLIRLIVRVIVPPSDVTKADEDLEDAIAKVIIALRPDQWSISVGEFGTLTVGNANYPACDITITNLIEIN